MLFKIMLTRNPKNSGRTFTMAPLRLLRSLSLCLLIGVQAEAAIKYSESYKFTNKETWEVPDASLPPGDYMLSVHDKLLDREVFQVKGATDGKVYSNFLAIHAATGQSKSVLSFWTGANGVKAIRGWFIASEAQNWEFVYPKERAIELAKASGNAIPAVDLSSMPKPNNVLLSPDDLHSVQLWLLTPKRVGPGADGMQIAAAKIGPKHPRATATGDETHAMPRTASHLLEMILAGCALIGIGGYSLTRAIVRRAS